MPNTMPRVAVVIPYYQKDSGILERTLQSVIRQTVDFAYEVIVVDDGSPVPASSMLSNSQFSQLNPQIRIIKQANLGPGAARNRGLDEVSEGVEYVAFIDSDDEWLPNHLMNSVKALDLGYDFYFSDFYFSDYKEKSAFVRAGKIPLSEHKYIDQNQNIYEYSGSMLDQIIVKGNVIGTSNVVFRYCKYSKLRFREEFFNGQDYLFWLDFSRLGGRICFSSNVEADCGRGSNIYAGAGWGTKRSLDRLLNELKLWKFVGKEFVDNREQLRANNKKIKNLRKGVVLDVMHRIRKLDITFGQVARLIRVDHALIWSFIPYSLSIVGTKVCKK